MSERFPTNAPRNINNVDFLIEVGAADHCTCTITAKDVDGRTIGDSQPLMVWISDSQTGHGLATDGPAGGLSAATGGGSYLQELTAKKCAIVLTNSSGQFVLDIEDDTTQVYFVCVSSLAAGFIAVSRVLSAADFGPGGA